MQGIQVIEVGNAVFVRDWFSIFASFLGATATLAVAFLTIAWDRRNRRKQLEREELVHWAGRLELLQDDIKGASSLVGFNNEAPWEMIELVDDGFSRMMRENPPREGSPANSLVRALRIWINRASAVALDAQWTVEEVARNSHPTYPGDEEIQALIEWKIAAAWRANLPLVIQSVQGQASIWISSGCPKKHVQVAERSTQVGAVPPVAMRREDEFIERDWIEKAS
ncbi:hypothetical protein GS502_13550 [Rhodococcus hoagii]|nr:hypothetical protein [Prescottella equi]